MRHTHHQGREETRTAQPKRWHAGGLDRVDHLFGCGFVPRRAPWEGRQLRAPSEMRKGDDCSPGGPVQSYCERLLHPVQGTHHGDGADREGGRGPNPELVPAAAVYAHTAHSCNPYGGLELKTEIQIGCAQGKAVNTQGKAANRSKKDDFLLVCPARCGQRGL